MSYGKKLSDYNFPYPLFTEDDLKAGLSSDDFGSLNSVEGFEIFKDIKDITIQFSRESKAIWCHLNDGEEYKLLDLDFYNKKDLTYVFFVLFMAAKNGTETLKIENNEHCFLKEINMKNKEEIYDAIFVCIKYRMSKESYTRKALFYNFYIPTITHGLLYFQIPEMDILTTSEMKERFSLISDIIKNETIVSFNKYDIVSETLNIDYEKDVCDYIIEKSMKKSSEEDTENSSSLRM